jgi:hypothetical protein
MTPSSTRVRLITGGLAVAALIALVAIPAWAADPSGSPETEPSGSVAPASSAPIVEPSVAASTAPLAPAASAAAPAATAEPTKAPKPSKGPKADRGGEEQAVTATGTVAVTTNANGKREYTLSDGTTVRVLSAGPPWFYGDDHPLQPFVGKRVTVTGTTEAGSDEIDVLKVGNVTIREPGRPPWAGGWKQVGEQHPGWSQEKWDRWQAKRTEQAERHGVSCWPPGHCKDKSAQGAAPKSTEKPGGD